MPGHAALGRVGQAEAASAASTRRLALTLGSDDVAAIIVEAATDGSDRLRYLIGDDSRGFIRARHELADQDYVDFMRSHFHPAS